jgi:signal transduction histidine kinase
LVSDFLDFARPADPVIESADLAHLLEQVWQMLLPELKARRIDFRLDRSTTAQAAADRHQVHQVLLNLIRNAAESCETGTGRVDLAIKTDAAAVEVKVRDNGAGIPETARARLFEPFFSTKRNGTGLGLSIARRIARNHGGDLTFETTVGRGTTFTLRLPLAR